MTLGSIGSVVRTGVRIDLHPEDPEDWVHIQRSDDGTTNTIEREYRVPGTFDQIFDSMPLTAGTKSYRTRGIGLTNCVAASTWTKWRKARPSETAFPDQPKTPVSKEMAFEPNRGPVTMHQKADMIGQLWRQSTSSSLNLRSYDGTTGDGVVTIEWDAATFLNGGETITIASGKTTDASPDTTYYLYHDSDDGSEITTTTQDNISDWPHMQIGSITSASEGSTQGSTDNPSGPPTEPL